MYLALSRATPWNLVHSPTKIVDPFFFQAEDGIRDWSVTGVQTCALPIWYVEAGRRVDDAASLPDAYRPHTTPGLYVPTLLPAVPNWGKRKPWVMTSGEQFRPGPPPSLTSQTWARDYNEIKALGAKNSTQRTPEQTAIAKFWEATAPAVYWPVARAVAAMPGREVTENARLLAAAAMAMDDGLTAVFDAKFTYNFWRPVTAIRNGDMDGNDATERDPSWSPLNDTLMHPEYPSQAAIINGVAVGVLESVFGPKPAIPFTTADLFDPNLKRQFNSIAEMDEEHRNVRIWGGIHFRNSLDVGYDMGKKIAAYLVDNSLKPAR